MSLPLATQCVDWESRDQASKLRIEASLRVQPDRDGWRKLGTDGAVKWGSMGLDTLEWPVWWKASRGIVDNKRLGNLLRAIGRYRKDIQRNGVVHDIVDPSLFSRLLNKTERDQFAIETCNWHTKTLAEPNSWRAVQAGRDADSFDFEVDNATDDLLSRDGIKVETKKQSRAELVRTRGAFQWIPAVYKCGIDENGKGNCRIVTRRIPGLPPRNCAMEIYQMIERIFSEMLPKIVHIVGMEELDRLQVVTKVQEYQLKPESVYEGHYHTEGFSERIIAGGVYYIDVDEDVMGGELKFTPWLSPAGCFQRVNDGVVCEEEERCEPLSLPVETGTMVVFSNKCPHKFEPIVNFSYRKRKRLFMNFFIVDPAMPLPETVEANFIVSLLNQKGITEKGIRKTFFAYLGLPEADLLHHKVLRDQAREQMVRSPQQFGCLDYGNAGEVRWLSHSAMIRHLHGDYSFWPDDHW
eukprot:CAMPEP_0203762656 /NCGR_PEP_ID=MMETSP0098-20131031/15489_1 /ASSEMBLY_ACC=CAM_ASM_000208 /TAXON_ID=96639 /ORGANISM=" , Strain NY0313808BC1" /LENGTH=465 /DNA_ID=CAMNT_0050657147 /DNA_START=152 /DNA_END=1546 /DNA_ORIENTATION=-